MQAFQGAASLGSSAGCKPVSRIRKLAGVGSIPNDLPPDYPKKIYSETVCAIIIDIVLVKKFELIL